MIIDQHHQEDNPPLYNHHCRHHHCDLDNFADVQTGRMGWVMGGAKIESGERMALWSNVSTEQGGIFS